MGKDIQRIFYRRHLPHWQPPGATIFLTWRLYGSLPKSVLSRLDEERRLLRQQLLRTAELLADREMRHAKQLFALTDKLLAQAEHGPHWLRDPRLTQLVVDALFFHADRLYTLLAFVVMSNHVHVLLRPLPSTSAPDTDEVCYVPLARITQSLKGYTARECNRLLQRTGQRFWQDESYDHWVRNGAELERIVAYIESDPVRSSLVETPEAWRYSSAWERQFGRWRQGHREIRLPGDEGGGGETGASAYDSGEVVVE